MKHSYPTALIALLFASCHAYAQPVPTILFTPSMLVAGSGPTQLHVYYTQASDGTYAVRWNGVSRPKSAKASATSSGSDIDLTAEDLAAPGMAEVIVYDVKSGANLASRFIFIGFNVIPNDVVYDNARKRFYLTTTITSQDTRFPANSLVTLDPETLRVGPVLSIGGFPTSLALSDDGKSLYVAVDFDGVVRRVNLDSFTVESEFRFRAALPARSDGYISPYGRSAIAVAPGTQTVAIYYHQDTASSGTRISVFDNGQKRANEIDSFDGDDGLLFTPDGKYLLLGSYSTFNAPGATLRYSVDAAGVARQTPVSARGGGPITIQNGILYTSGGTMIDPQKMEVVGNLGVSGAVAVDAQNQRIFAAYFRNSQYYQDYPEYLQSFDLSTQTPLGWMFFDSWYYFGAGANRGLRLFRFGADGLLYTGSKGLMLFHTPLAGPAPSASAAAVVNSASQQAGSIAPGEILSIYGANLGPETPVTAQLNSVNAYDPSVGYVQAWFDQTPGTVLLAYKSQVNVIAPFNLRPGSTVNLQLWYFGIPSARIPLRVSASAPGLYTRDGSGSGQVAVINQNGSINTAAPPGNYITLFGTGGGTIPGAVDGGLARSAKSLDGAVSVSIGGKSAPVLYGGAAPQLVNGLFQVNVQVPSDIPPGAAPITVSINGHESSKGATLEIR